MTRFIAKDAIYEKGYFKHLIFNALQTSIKSNLRTNWTKFVFIDEQEKTSKDYNRHPIFVCCSVNISTILPTGKFKD